MRQLDIFLDSHEVALANAVVAALCAHEGERAAQAVASLRAEAPQRPELPAFALLADCLALFEKPDLAALDTNAMAAVVDLLEARVVPAARVLGSRSEAFLPFFWKRLARAAGDAFDAQRPHLAAADLFLRAGDHAAAETAARAIVGHPTHPAVLRWQAIARHRLAGATGALAEIFAAAWHHPDRFPALLAELGDTRLDRDWSQFQAAVDELDAAWFPAWYLNHHSEAVGAIDAALQRYPRPADEPRSAMHACVLLAGIVELEERGHSRELIEQRARLRALDAEFFALYMRSRSVRHR